MKEQRPAENLGVTPDGRVKMGNVRWGFTEAPGASPEPVFQQATVDPTKVKDVYVVLEPFKPEWIAGHSFLMFDFKDGEGVRAQDGTTDSGLVVSVEARLREGQRFSLPEGMKKKFGLVYQLGSWKDVVQKSCRNAPHKLIRYRLKLDDGQKEQLLRNSLDASFKDRSAEFYNTVTDSCYSNVVHLLNGVLPREKRIHEWLLPGVLYNPAADLPLTASFVLGMKGVIDDSPPVLTQPDRRKFPDAQATDSFFKKAARAASELPGWHVASAMAGAVLGAAAGALVPPPGVGLLLGGLLGGSAANEASHWLERESHCRLEPAEKYLAV